MSNRFTPETDAAEAKRRAEWLHKHKAHKDWIILSVSEVAVIREELLMFEHERDEALEKIKQQKLEIVRLNGATNHAGGTPLKIALREREEAREELENVKLQLRLWEDGNIICEETLGEIRLLEEQIKQALLERNKLYKIAERAIEDLAWFNETNSQRLRTELEQLKEEAK
jgi:hypothetical protein